MNCAYLEIQEHEWNEKVAANSQNVNEKSFFFLFLSLASGTIREHRSVLLLSHKKVSNKQWEEEEEGGKNWCGCNHKTFCLLRTLWNPIWQTERMTIHANVNETPGNMKIEESERTLLASVLHYIGVFCNEWRSFSLSKFRVNCLNN